MLVYPAKSAAGGRQTTTTTTTTTSFAPRNHSSISSSLAGQQQHNNIPNKIPEQNTKNFIIGASSITPHTLIIIARLSSGRRAAALQSFIKTIGEFGRDFPFPFQVMATAIVE
jgi:hypothetical protein